MRLFEKRFEAHELDFAQFKQDFPFMASAVEELGGQVPKNRLHQAHYLHIGRNEFRLLGRVRAATKSLKGRLAVAQPPGATMAVRENKLARVALEVKGAPLSLSANS
jgi:hypothetical protein